MLQGMTDFLVNISSRRDVIELMYRETAKTNLIYALGKYIQASSSRSGANKAVSNAPFRKVKKTCGSLVGQYLRTFTGRPLLLRTQIPTAPRHALSARAKKKNKR